MFAWLRRLINGSNGSTPHRFRCTECREAWDRASLDWPGETVRSFYEPPHPKRPYHHRAVIVQASDGPRRQLRICGPIKYEGERVSDDELELPTPDWPDAPEAQN